MILASHGWLQVANPPAMHRTAPNKEYAAPNAKSIQAEKPHLGVIYTTSLKAAAFRTVEPLKQLASGALVWI